MKSFLFIAAFFISFVATGAYVKLPVTGGGGGAVSSVNGQTGDVVLTKSDLGLSNVSNPTYSRNTTDSTHKESDGIINITDMDVSVAANTRYLISCYVSYNAPSAQAVIDIYSSFPSGFNYADYGPTGPNEVLATCQSRTPSNGTACVRFLNVTTNYPGNTMFYINFSNGSSAGTVGFRWVAKSNSDNDVTIYAGSYCKAEPLP